MSVIDKFTGGIVTSVGEGLDNLFTSDEERLQARNVFAGINAKIVESGNVLRGQIMAAVSKRHEVDMMSDSWLSKNIRPMTLVLMTFSTLGFMLFSSPETEVELAAFDLKLQVLTALDLMIFGFYFGSRGVEKVAASIAKAMNKPKKKTPVEIDDDEEETW